MTAITTKTGIFCFLIRSDLADAYIRRHPHLIIAKDERA